MGGAFYYQNQIPKLVNNYMQNNSAPYGNDVGSYSVKIFLNGTISNQMTIENAASGQVYPYPFTLNLVDNDGQIVNKDN